MSRFNTGNPLGSGDPRDLDDNAKNMDLAMNSPERVWVDRLGRERKTFASVEVALDEASNAAETAATVQIPNIIASLNIEAAAALDSAEASWEVRFSDFLATSGYQFLADYGPGIEITEYNQVVRDADGELWRVSSLIDLPYTTTGAGLPEGEVFVSAGDAVLRQDLASTLEGGGAAIIGNGIVALESVADMLALPAGAKRQDLRYLVRGYHHGTAEGGGEFYFDPTRTGENDGGTVLSGFVRVLRGPILPEQFGARGNGIAVDTAAVKNALAVGGDIELTPGKIYLIDQMLTLPARATLNGRLSTIKRIDGFDTSITSAVTSPAANRASFTVASVGDFSVGQSVMLYQGGTHFPYNQNIVSIVGSTVTIATHASFNISAFGVGSRVCRAFKMIQMYDYSAVHNLFLDGNRAGNQGPAKWQNHQGLIGWLGTLINNCHIRDEPGEGILQYLDGGRIVGTVVDTCGGNGIHFSGGNGITVEGSRIANTNLTAGVGHEDGNLCWSNNCQDITVTNTHLENGKSAFGSIDYAGNSDVTLTDNVIRSQRETALDMLITAGEASAAGNVIISNNRFYDSKRLIIKDPAAVRYATNISISNNLFVNTSIDAASVKDISITDNIMDSSSAMNSIVLHDCDFTLKGNTIKGGNFSVLYTSSRGLIEGNMITDSVSGSIANNGPSEAAASEVLVTNNFIKNSASSATLNLILLRHADTAIGNRIVANGVRYAMYCSGNRVVVASNRVKVVTGETIRLDAGFAGAVIKGNYLSKPVNNASADPSNIVTDNEIVE